MSIIGSPWDYSLIGKLSKLQKWQELQGVTKNSIERSRRQCQSFQNHNLFTESSPYLQFNLFSAQGNFLFFIRWQVFQKEEQLCTNFQEADPTKFLLFFNQNGHFISGTVIKNRRIEFKIVHAQVCFVSSKNFLQHQQPLGMHSNY